MLSCPSLSKQPVAQRSSNLNFDSDLRITLVLWWFLRYCANKYDSELVSYYCVIRHYETVFVFATFCTIMRTPPPSRWSYGLLGPLGRRHAQTPCDSGFTRPRNVRCHQGHWSWSWPVWPQLEGYRVGNPILQET